MTCPDCERYKISASMWRNEAYKLGGTPLPWDADELIEKAVLAEREACAQYLQDQNTAITDKLAAEIRARGQA